MTPDKIGETLEYYAGQGVDIRLKTCQEYVSTGDSRYPKRTGMFVMDADEYEILLNSDGYYLFLVKCDENIIAGRLIAACDITYRKQKNWREVFDG